MKGRVGSKNYNTETATLIEVLPDGTKVYQKKGRSMEFFCFNPAGETARQRFQDLEQQDAVKYIDFPKDASRKVFRSGVGMQLSAYDRDRIKRCAQMEGMSMTQFVMMLVSQYELSHR